MDFMLLTFFMLTSWWICWNVHLDSESTNHNILHIINTLSCGVLLVFVYRNTETVASETSSTVWISSRRTVNAVTGRNPWRSTERFLIFLFEFSVWVFCVQRPHRFWMFCRVVLDAWSNAHFEVGEFPQPQISLWHGCWHLSARAVSCHQSRVMPFHFVPKTEVCYSSVRCWASCHQLLAATSNCWWRTWDGQKLSHTRFVHSIYWIWTFTKTLLRVFKNRFHFSRRFLQH